MKKILTMAAVAAGIFTFFSCCQNIDIAGEWNVSEVEGNALPELFEGQKAPFLSFDAAEGRLHGNTGVNIINSSYSLDGRKIEIGMAASTMMAGPEEWMKVERGIIDALGKAKTVKSPSKDTLELCDSTGTAVLTLVRQ